MRVQLPPAAPATIPAPAGPSAAIRRRRLDWYEFSLLGLFGALSMWVVGLDVWRAVLNGLVWTGTDGFYIVDQMQYLSWIQSAAHHGLVSNLFVLRSTPADYFQPAIIISGGITALGVPSWLALLLWKPVAVVGLFLAIRAVVDRLFAGRFERRAALTLGLLFASFSVVYGTLGIVGDTMSVWISWGYPFALMAVALIVFGLVRYDRSRTAGRVDWIPGVLGALASTLHPWQGETMILLILGAEVMRWRDLRLWWRTRQWRRLALPVLTLALVALPLLYYLLLGHLDLSWSLARENSKHAFPWTAIAIGVAPLGIVALLGYRGRSDSFLELLMRVWGPAAILIYIFSATGLSATPLHAFDGITIPLAVLAVKGVRRSRLRSLPRGRLIGGLAVAIGVLPVNAYAVDIAPAAVAPAADNANFITKDEHAALRYLAKDKTPGGVLTQFYMGEAVPGSTGRHTNVGDCLWSQPGCMTLSTNADALFDGEMSRAQARRFVATTGARFLLASCSAPVVNLRRRLGSALIVSVTHFGCATVYQVAPPTTTS
ncbi:MAG TPA: hypothetical protein VG371_06390 [Solirubrobacteraceae bacterium]|nr:hypothetical protein [Solirubrobacteraceae bacterium]